MDNSQSVEEDDLPLIMGRIRQMISIKKRLLKSPDHAKMYANQKEELVTNVSARKLSKQELTGHNGPVHYISDHDDLVGRMSCRAITASIIRTGLNGNPLHCQLAFPISSQLR